MPRLPVVPCNVVVDAGLEAWIHGLNRCVMKGINKALSCGKVEKAWVNRTGLVNVGMKMLKGNVMAIKADKQHGYVIEDRDTTVRVHEDILVLNHTAKSPHVR
jgi:hypothetical protein